MAYDVKKAWRGTSQKVMVNLPYSRIGALNNVPSRFQVRLEEATQEQLGLLYNIGHPAIEQVKKETK